MTKPIWDTVGVSHNSCVKMFEHYHMDRCVRVRVHAWVCICIQSYVMYSVCFNVQDHNEGCAHEMIVIMSLDRAEVN